MAATSKTGRNDFRLISSLAGGFALLHECDISRPGLAYCPGFKADRVVQLQVRGGVL
jgi:hypothetical protein